MIALQAVAESIKGLSAGGALPSKLVDAILVAAIRFEASDAHFEPVDSGLLIRLRIDGTLQDVVLLPIEQSATVIARLKVLATLATYRTDVPQDGRIGGENFGRPGAEIRLSTYPTVRGEKAVARFFVRSAEDFRLASLGLGDGAVEALQSALAAREGLIVLTGPAGSGKTTTIYSVLNHVRSSRNAPRQIVTIEDPVECLLPGVTQTEIDQPAGLGFANCLRSILRQDPEVIMVGEVRDVETARLASEAALTGHLVLTTVHAGTAPGTLVRLIDMGVEPSVLSGVLKLSLAQRLVRRLCPACRHQGADASWSAVGCEQCLGTGCHGRLPVSEWLVVGAEMRQALVRRADLVELRRLAREAGMLSMVAQGRLLAEQGLTSHSEIARVLMGVDES